MHVIKYLKYYFMCLLAVTYYWWMFVKLMLRPKFKLLQLNNIYLYVCMCMGARAMYVSYYYYIFFKDKKLSRILHPTHVGPYSKEIYGLIIDLVFHLKCHDKPTSILKNKIHIDLTDKNKFNQSFTIVTKTHQLIFLFSVCARARTHRGKIGQKWIK